MKRIIYGLFDVANSPFTILIITFVFGPYFAKEIVGDPVKGAAYWQWTSGLCAIVIAIFGTFLGSISDRIENGRKYFFIISTLLCILITTLLYNAMPSKEYILYTLMIFFLANFFYEISQMFYHSFLKNFSEKKNIGHVSGFAFALGYLSILPILYFVLEFFLKPEVTLFNLDKSLSEHIRFVAYIVSVWFLIFSIPIFVIVFNLNTERSNENKFFPGIKKILWDNGLTKRGKFLLARLFYADGLIVLITGGGVYAAGVHEFNIKELIALSFIGNIAAAVGAFFGGYFNDKLGSKKIIEFCLIGLMFLIVLMVLTRNKLEFLVIVMFVAILVGPLQSASRVLMVKLLDAKDLGKGFGLFTFSARSTSFIGPLLVGTLTYYVSQKYALLAVIPLFYIGYFIFKKITFDEDINNIM